MPLSVVIITLNAAEHIRACLDSVKWAEEIVVLDSGSTDETVEICREYTAHVHQTDWPGFGKQKNRAIDHATHNWVLVLDADEYLAPELQAEIRFVIEQETTVGAYKIKRISTFMGKPIRHGDWGKDWITRLFQKDTARYTEALVHENLVVNGEVGSLRGILQHDTLTSLESALRKLNEYTTLGAEQMRVRGKHASLTQASVRGLWSFCRSYFINLGFLDGREGYLIALLIAQASFYKYVKCAYLNH
jgi:glycosyltransferase involved in cell wall biosynthesis